MARSGRRTRSASRPPRAPPRAVPRSTAPSRIANPKTWIPVMGSSSRNHATSAPSARAPVRKSVIAGSKARRPVGRGSDRGGASGGGEDGAGGGAGIGGGRGARQRAGEESGRRGGRGPSAARASVRAAESVAAAAPASVVAAREAPSAITRSRAASRFPEAARRRGGRLPEHREEMPRREPDARRRAERVDAVEPAGRPAGAPDVLQGTPDQEGERGSEERRRDHQDRERYDRRGPGRGARLQAQEMEDGQVRVRHEGEHERREEDEGARDGLAPGGGAERGSCGSGRGVR